MGHAALGGANGHRRMFYYGCSYHQNRGRTVCSNDFRARMEEADALVIGRIRERITPKVIDDAVERACEQLAEIRRAQVERPAKLEAELRSLRRKRENLLAAIADGKAPKSVVEVIAKLDADIEAKERELSTLMIEEPSDFELRRLRKSFRERIGKFDELLLADVPLARQGLRKLLAGRIEFHPEEQKGERKYHLRWALSVKPLIDGGYI